MKQKTHTINTSKTGKHYEDIVADIHLQFSNSSQVTKNEFITGKSGQRRQIDISLRAEISGYPILMIVECKKYNRPVDIGEVDELIGKVDDVSAAKGILASDSGFTSGALKRAKEDRHIQLISVIDTTNTKLKSKIIYPVYVTYHDLGEQSFSLSVDNHESISNDKTQDGKETIPLSINKLIEIIRSNTLPFLERCYSWHEKNGQNLNKGLNEYAEVIHDDQEGKVTFKFSFQKNIRSYVNENISIEVVGIYDHLNQTLIQHKELNPKIYTIEENEVIKTWRKLPDNFNFSEIKEHYERIALFDKNRLEAHTEEIVHQLISQIHDKYGTTTDI